MTHRHARPMRERIAFLIELKETYKGVLWLQFSGYGEKTCPDAAWTRDAWAATHFGRREDAENMLAYLEVYDDNPKAKATRDNLRLREIAHVTEHVFEEVVDG